MPDAPRARAADGAVIDLERASPDGATGGSVLVHDPRGFPPAVERKAAAARPDTLEGKVVYLVDVRFDDSGELLRQVAAWFADEMPSVTIRPVALKGNYGQDDPELWETIRAEGDAAIIGVGHCSSCAPAVATHAITLETRYGIPTVTLHTSKFDRVVRSVLRVAGMPAAPAVFVPQPVMGKTASELRAYVDGADPVSGAPVMQAVLAGLTTAPAAAVEAPERKPRARPMVGAASEDALHDLFLRNDWTDKLPIVLPTEARVARMLAHTSRRPDEIVGRMQPTSNRGKWEFTVEKVAVNAVMAGASPEYFPVILALASSGMTARSSSSSSGAAMVLVNGPIRDEIGMNSGIGAMGPFNHANATIGRAYGLLSQNLQGGSVPGETYMGSLGNSYAYNNVTFAENEERSPWEPFHVQHGFATSDSVATIFWGCRSTGFSLGLREGHWREHVRDLLVAVDPVAGPMLLLDPIVANQFVERGGFADKQALIEFLFEEATMPAARYWDLQLVRNYIHTEVTGDPGAHPARLDASGDEPVHMFRKGDIGVAVVGGETNGYWQIMGAKRVTSVRIDDWR